MRLIILLALLFLGPFGLSAAEQTPNPKVIILNSYHRGFAWSDEELTGLIEQLQTRYPQIDPSIEYLDTKRFSTPDHLLRVKNYLANKYRGRKFDIVITLDNSALEMALGLRPELFHETPIVFAGINNYRPSMLVGQEKVTGVAEKLDIAGTLQTALSLHPQTKTVFAIHDYTNTGPAVRKELEAILPAFQDRVQVKFSPPATMAELIEQLKGLPADALVLFLNFAADKSGQTFTLSESTQRITSSISIPVYAGQEARLGHGILGGYLLAGKDHGRRAGDIALRVLAGKDPSHIPVDMKSTARPMFDFNQLRRFHIPLSVLPASSIIINHPSSFYEVNQSLVWGISGIVIALSLMVIVLSINITRRRRAETEILRFASFPRLNPNPVLEVDLGSKITYVNENAYEALRKMGRENPSVFLPADMDNLIRQYQEKGEKQFFREVAIGDAVFAEVIHVAEEFKTLRLFAIDITKRKQAEEALRTSESFLNSIFYHSPYPTWISDDQGTLIRINLACQDMLHITQEEVVGKYNVLQDNIVQQQGLLPLFERVFKEGESIRFELIYDTSLLNTINLENTVSVILDTTVSPIKDATGRITNAVCQHIDITARKRAEEAFQALVNYAPMGIYVVQDSKFQLVNPGFEQISGYTAGELLGRNSLTLVQPDYQEAVRKNAIAMVKGKLHAAYEFPITTKSGEIRWVVERLTSTGYQGKRATLGYFLDISERKALEAQFLQAQKMEAVGRLAGGVAHDFNNMLGVIIGHAELAMMEVSVTEPLYQNLQEIRKAAQRSADLTRQLLAFARQQTVKPRVLDLNDTVSGMLKMLQRLIGEDIDLVWAAGHDLWKVKIDPSQIDQILANVAVNARDAIAGVGKITIETTNASLDDAYCSDHAEFVPGEYVLLAVGDDGCGMDKEILAQIFEPFFTTKGVGQGTGLGLATVYGIVKQNDGFINVYSEPGQGTTFKIYLPRCQAEATQDQAETAVKSLPGGSETVLLVEDEKAILELGQAMLEKLGYTVLTAGTPEEAIRLAGEHTGDMQLLISDVVMPEMNGRELAERLIVMKPRLKSLYMSGYTANVIARRGVLDEGVQFLQKPFSLKALATKVREVLEG
ncbi:MAG: PAS domain S-box protein [Deltaproteobacteria bacterium]|nr:PAS domain S-box protein [Deltaproteobacteria bacterium]